MKAYEVRKQAREALKGKWGKAVLITLAYVGLILMFSFIAGKFEENSLVYNIIEIVTAILQVPLSLGIGYSFIKLKRNEKVKIFDFGNLGFSNFGRAWKIALRVTLKMILPFIGMIIGILLLIAISVMITVNSIVGGASATSFVGVSVLGLIIFFASYVWMLILSLNYSLTTYIAYDNPNMSSLAVVNESKRMMNGNKWKIFVLGVSFIGLYLLAFITLGIGYLCLMPYIQVASICFYENLLGKNENNISDNNNNDAIVEM